MVRPLRIEYEGAVYHITARGNERKRIYKSNSDYNKFIETLNGNKQRYGIKIYGYVLMPNHYHIILETPDGNLNKVMHDIQTKYTIYYNHKHKRVGHLFQGRYKALIVDKDTYLLELVRYIHLNPVRAGIVKAAKDYLWSGHREYLGIGKNEIIDKAIVLEQFSKNEIESIKKYDEFVKSGLKIKQEEIRKNVYGQSIIGTKEFVDKIKKKIKPNKIDKEITLGRKLVPRKSVTEITEKVCKWYNIACDELKSKIGRWNEPRKVAIYLIRKYTDMPLKLIATEFGGVHYSAISQMVKRIGNKRITKKRFDTELKSIENKL